MTSSFFEGQAGLNAFARLTLLCPSAPGPRDHEQEVLDICGDILTGTTAPVLLPNPYSELETTEHQHPASSETHQHPASSETHQHPASTEITSEHQKSACDKSTPVLQQRISIKSANTHQHPTATDTIGVNQDLEEYPSPEDGLLNSAQYARGLTQSLARCALLTEEASVVIRVCISVGHSGTTLALVDTGSTYNLIDLDFARTHIIDFEKVFKKQDIPGITLGDGETKIYPCGIVRNVPFSMTNTEGQIVFSYGTFVVIANFSTSELLVIGHRYFLTGASRQGSSKHRRPAEISYSLRCLYEGTDRIPWQYHLPDLSSRSRALMLTRKSTTLAPGYATRIACYHPEVRTQVPEFRRKTDRPWGTFTNVCPNGCLLTFFESFGHLSIEGEVDLWMTNHGLIPIILKVDHPLCVFEEESNLCLVSSCCHQKKGVHLQPTYFHHQNNDRL